jgi:hypothetical protein
MKEPTTTSSVDYFNLPRPLWRKLKNQEVPAQAKEEQGYERR